MSAVSIEYNIVEAHYLIAELREKLEAAEKQADLYLEGLLDYAESDWWRQENPGKPLDIHLIDAEKDYTLG